MIDILDIAPFEDELPGDFADRLGTDYTARVTKGHKKQNGQFFTPTAIARFMGGLAGSPKERVRILDPGCGTAILTCALVEKLTGGAENLRAIDVTAYETDQEILPYTERAFEYLKAWLKSRSIELVYKIISKDFILENARVFEDGHTISLFDRPQQEQFDYIISNPPYFKLSKEDPRTKVSGSGAEEDVINIFRNWNHRLRDYGIEISTGPVVAFRARKFIRERFENGKVVLAPLYWLHNVIKMSIEWPVHKIGKGQYIEICDASEPVLIPNRNYVLLRRFSAKDDKSRLIAAPYFVNPNEPDYIGVENKLNYIYRPKGELERSEAVGLAALLNSKLFDTYFRTFNGNVNVSATELREIPLPPLETIKEIGNRIIQDNDFAESKVGATVAEFFNPEEITSV